MVLVSNNPRGWYAIKQKNRNPQSPIYKKDDRIFLKNCKGYKIKWQILDEKKKNYKDTF